MERAICAKLEPLMAHYGFTLHKDWGHFVRPKPYGHDAVMVFERNGLTDPDAPQHDIGMHCAIRHARIEIPWNMLGFVDGADRQRQTNTIVLEHPRGTPVPPMVVTSSSMSVAISRVASAAAATFFETGLPFYRRFGELSAIEELANRVPLAELQPYSIGERMEHRAMRGLLLAKAANPGRYRLVRDAYADLENGLFPRQRRLEMLNRVDALQIAPPAGLRALW